MADAPQTEAPSEQDDPEGPAPALSLEVAPEIDDEELLKGVRRTLVNHPRVRAEYASTDLWMVGFDLVSKDGDATQNFCTILHDLTEGQVVEAAGVVGEPDTFVVEPTSRERRPSPEEFTYAVGILRQDPDTASRLDEGTLEAYWPMPPLASTVSPNGQPGRTITVGLRDTEREPRHRVAGVRSEDGVVLFDLPDLPRPSNAECGVDPGPDSDPTVGPPRLRVRVMRGKEMVWDLTVVRPSASSGANGSGVELREVNYRRQRVLHRGHAPIVNVGFDDQKGPCGPGYRTWLNEEWPFHAEGDDAAPGWRLCTSAPGTTVDGQPDSGDFRGVALWLDCDELVITSQLRAGWYRYVSEWRLHADGTIQPRFGATAVRNPASCHPHTHHAFWRLDFDITTSDNNLVQEFNDPIMGGNLSPWQTIRYEVRRPRDPSHQRQWRVRHARSSLGYSIEPGPGDGTADDFGAGDVWVLAYRDSEVDDGQGFTTDPHLARAQVDRFVSGEELSRADVVIWYGAHAGQVGDPATGELVPVRVGPDLRPFNWRPPLDQAPFGPLLPPNPDADEPGKD